MRLLLYNTEGGALSLAPDTKLLVPVTLLNESVEEAVLTLNEITLAGPQAQVLSFTPGVTTVTIRALPKEFSLSTNRPVQSEHANRLRCAGTGACDAYHL